MGINLTHNEDGSIDIHIDGEYAERLTDPDEEFWDFEVLLERRDDRAIDVLEVEVHTWGIIAGGTVEEEFPGVHGL